MMQPFWKDNMHIVIQPVCKYYGCIRGKICNRIFQLIGIRDSDHFTAAVHILFAKIKRRYIGFCIFGFRKRLWLWLWCRVWFFHLLITRNCYFPVIKEVIIALRASVVTDNFRDITYLIGVACDVSISVKPFMNVGNYGVTPTFWNFKVQHHPALAICNKHFSLV